MSLFDTLSVIHLICINTVSIKSLMIKLKLVRATLKFTLKWDFVTKIIKGGRKL